MPHPHEAFRFCVQEAAIQRKRYAANRSFPESHAKDFSSSERGCPPLQLYGPQLTALN